MTDFAAQLVEESFEKAKVFIEVEFSAAEKTVNERRMKSLDEISSVLQETTVQIEIFIKEKVKTFKRSAEFHNNSKAKIIKCIEGIEKLNQKSKTYELSQELTKMGKTMEKELQVEVIIIYF
jgi:hypothetical protein